MNRPLIWPTRTMFQWRSGLPARVRFVIPPLARLHPRDTRDILTGAGISAVRFVLPPEAKHFRVRLVRWAAAGPFEVFGLAVRFVSSTGASGHAAAAAAGARVRSADGLIACGDRDVAAGLDSSSVGAAPVLPTSVGFVSSFARSIAVNRQSMSSHIALLRRATEGYS